MGPKFGSPQHFQLIEDLLNERQAKIERLEMALYKIAKEGKDCSGPWAVAIAIGALGSGTYFPIIDEQKSPGVFEESGKCCRD